MQDREVDLCVGAQHGRGCDVGFGIVVRDLYGIGVYVRLRHAGVMVVLLSGSLLRCHSGEEFWGAEVEFVFCRFILDDRGRFGGLKRRWRGFRRSWWCLLDENHGMLQGSLSHEKANRASGSRTFLREPTPNLRHQPLLYSTNIYIYVTDPYLDVYLILPIIKVGQSWRNLPITWLI